MSQELLRAAKQMPRQSLDSPAMCARCGREIVELCIAEIVASNGVSHRKGHCPSCGNFVKFVSQGKPAVLYFGKYRGREIDAIAIEDPEYLKWLLGQNWLKSNLRISIEKAMK